MFDSTDDQGPAVGETIAEDKHFTIAELAKLWHIAPSTLRRIFSDEQDVLKFGAGPERRCRSPRRRRLVQMRIPMRTAMRVHRKLSSN